MRKINIYIIEKLKIDSDTKVEKSEQESILPNSEQGKRILSNFSTKYDIISRSKSYKIELKEKNNHFCITSKDIDKKQPWSIFHFFLDELVKCGLGGQYIIASYYDRIDTSSRINKLKRRYWNFLLGEDGILFNSPKETREAIRNGKSNYHLGGDKKYKVMTVKEASKIEGSIYGDSLGDIYPIA